MPGCRSSQLGGRNLCKELQEKYLRNYEAETCNLERLCEAAGRGDVAAGMPQQPAR